MTYQEDRALLKHNLLRYFDLFVAAIEDKEKTEDVERNIEFKTNLQAIDDLSFDKFEQTSFRLTFSFYTLYINRSALIGEPEQRPNKTIHVTNSLSSRMACTLRTRTHLKVLGIEPPQDENAFKTYTIEAVKADARDQIAKYLNTIPAQEHPAIVQERYAKSVTTSLDNCLSESGEAGRCILAGIPKLPNQEQPTVTTSPDGRKTTIHIPGTQGKTIGQIPEARDTATFPTPPGTQWNEVKFTFIDNENVRITAKDVTLLKHYSEMGFKNGNTTKPVRSWLALTTLCQQGYLRYPEATKTKIEKRIQDLRKRLREYFGIQGDPITLEDGYRPVFKVCTNESKGRSRSVNAFSNIDTFNEGNDDD